MSPENQILNAIIEAITSGAVGAGWLIVLALAYLFRKKIGAALINNANGNLQQQISDLENNHLGDIVDRLNRIEADVSDMRERLASVETELKINRDRR